MQERILSIFIDESGDFGPYNPAAPYYLVAMILHDQRNYWSEKAKQIISAGQRRNSLVPIEILEKIYSNKL